MSKLISGDVGFSTRPPEFDFSLQVFHGFTPRIDNRTNDFDLEEAVGQSN